MDGGSLADSLAAGAVISAHGVGGGKDLPIPAGIAITAGVVALIVSFTVLILAWRTPRYENRPGRPVVGWLATMVDSTWFTALARTFGMVCFGYTLVVLLFGKDDALNPAFWLFMVVLWVGIVPASLLLGPVWKAISPARTLVIGLSRLAGTDPENGMMKYPARLGYWPAALGLYSFVWFELVNPNNTMLSQVRLWILLWLVVCVLGGVLFGTTWTKHVDPFEVYSSLVARLSVWGRDDAGRLVLRTPLANLATIPPTPGLTVVVAVLFGSTAYDSFHESVPFVKLLQSGDVDASLLRNLGLLTFCLVVGVVFVLGTMATGVEARTRRTHLPNLFAHSVIPIIVGYIGAHYLTYLVEKGQQTLIYMSDPLGNGSDLLGTGNLQVNYWLSMHPTFLATTKGLLVVLGHVVGVVAAHDRALALLPKRHQIIGQLGLLVTMVLFTGGGLYLLFAS